MDQKTKNFLDAAASSEHDEEWSKYKYLLQVKINNPSVDTLAFFDTFRHLADKMVVTNHPNDPTYDRSKISKINFLLTSQDKYDRLDEALSHPCIAEDDLFRN